MFWGINRNFLHVTVTSQSRDGHASFVHVLWLFAFAILQFCFL